MGGLTDQNAIGRRDGFNAALAGQPGVTIVSQVPTDWNPTEALDGTSNALQKDPTINAIYIPSDFLLPSVQSALTSANRLMPIGNPKHVFMVTIDGDQNGCKAMRAKMLDADIATPVADFGKQAIAAITAALGGKPVTPRTVQAKGLILDQANYAATSPQVLVNPTYRDTVVHTAQRFAAQNAVAHVPPGPRHDQVAASVATQAMQQAQHLLDQVFAALKLSLAFAIQHGLIAVLVFCGLTIVATFFLKDIPMTQQSSDAPDENGAEVSSGEDLSVMP